LYTIAGGKLTTWRSMAEEMVNELAGYLGREHGVLPARPPGTTHRLLPGGDIGDWHLYLAERVLALSDRFAPDTVIQLVSAYGARYPDALAPIGEDECLAQPLLPGLPYLKAEVLHAVRREMAITLEDVLNRRTHVLDQDWDQGLTVADEVAALMGAELGWPAAERARQVEDYRRVVEQTRRWRS
jgi:glycerol-3-phosphate dehydrogenase